MKFYRTISGRIITCIIFFVVFSSICFFNNLKENALREPIESYASIEEEYIASIDHFLRSGEIIVPEGATFHYDGDVIQITDKHTNATETCKFILDGRMPIYEWSYKNFVMTAFVVNIIALAIISVILYLVLLAFSVGYPMLKNRQTLNMLKSSATFGDNRLSANNESATCMKCERMFNCKCMRCMYLGECGNCPTSDCEDMFEEEMHENRNHEADNDFGEPEVVKENVEDKCITCDYFEKCKECPSENCIQNFEATYKTKTEDVDSDKSKDSLVVIEFKDDEPEAGNI